MNRFIPLFYLPQKVSRQSGMYLVWVMFLAGNCLKPSLSYSQDVLWGLTPGGGPKGAGTIFSLKITGEDFTVHQAFRNGPNSPKGSLIEGKDGNLYGMTAAGGNGGSGTIFKISQDGTGLTVLYSFQISTDGAAPEGSLTEGSDGYFYGITNQGEMVYDRDCECYLSDHGTIFKISADGTDFTVLKGFGDRSTSGDFPRGNLLEGIDGYFYGITYSNIFKIAPDGTDYTVLKSFNGTTEGTNLNGSLIQGNDGQLYGMTTSGGEGIKPNQWPSGYGTIFKIAPDGTNFTVLHSFNGSTDGANPYGSLIKDKDGLLYGMTLLGGDSSGSENEGGTIFKIATDGTEFSVLHSFNRSTDGDLPFGSLHIGSDGLLYGMTSRGGTYSEIPYRGGTIFRINPNGTGFTVLKNFKPYIDGTNPHGDLIEGSDGNFYGMTSGGGINNAAGSVFKIKPDGTAFTVLNFFNPFPDGVAPNGQLVEDTNGYFYGMQSIGGNYNRGAVFKIGTDGKAFTILKHFGSDTTDGAGPGGSLIQGKDGYLYGTTQEGGLNNYGIIFKMSHDGNSFIILHSFKGSTDGGSPRGSLVEGKNGFLYGLAGGVFFKIAPDGTGYKVIYRFNGVSPNKELVQGSDGFFYGMTERGNNDEEYGTIFKLAPDGSNFINLKTFYSLTEGAWPQGGLIEGKDGYLYGMTRDGGAISDFSQAGSGIIFKIAPDGSNFTKLHAFEPEISPQGAYPHGNLTEGSDGYLYGMTSGNGASGGSGYGSIFKLAANGTGFTVLRTFNPTTDGANPYGNLIIQKGKKTAALQVNFQNRWAKPPQGWLKDYGLPFAEKQVADSTLSFGWKRRDTAEPINLSVGGNFPGNEGNGRQRPTPADPLLATLLHMQGNHVKNFRGTPVESYWELAVENGVYLVTVSVGDGLRYTYTDPESHSVNVEGVAAITNFVPQGSNGSMTRFKQATIKVTVSDSLLTIDADGGTNTKINYAIIRPVSSSAAIARKDFFPQAAETEATVRAYPNPFISDLTLTGKGLQGNVEITIYDVTGHTLYQATQQSTAPTLFIDLSAANLKPGMYLLRLTTQDGTSRSLKVWKR